MPERTLPPICYGYENIFNDMFEINIEVNYLSKQDRKLMITICKLINSLSNAITNETFSKKNIKNNVRK